MAGFIKVALQHDFAALAARYTELERRQLPFAIRRALGDVVKGAAADMKKQMPTIFDRPTPFTRNAVYAKPPGSASGAGYTAFVGIRFTAPKGTPASVFLAPEIEGGERGLKRFEKRLAFGGALPTAMPAVPTDAAPRDAYGNVAPPFLGQVLGHLRVFEDGQNVGPKKLAKLQRRKLLTKTARGMAKFFVARSKLDGQPLGIWNVLGHGIVKPIFFFARRVPSYPKRFDFYGIAQRSYEERFMVALNQRFAEAWRTRR